MCGRYTGYVDEDEEIKSIYTVTTKAYPGVKLGSGEIFPTDTVPILCGTTEGIVPIPASWGYPKFEGKGVIINARAETAAVKYTFKDSILSRRCAVPTTGYLEWSADKTKYRFNLPGESVLYLAGFYKRFDDAFRFVILTTEANDSVAAFHDRMPVILEKDYLAVWTANTAAALEYLHSTMPGLTAVGC